MTRTSPTPPRGHRGARRSPRRLFAGSSLILLLSLFAWQAVPSSPAATSLGWSIVKVGPKDGGGEPSIAYGPEGNAYVSYPSDSGMSFYRSFDGGRAWDRGRVADDFSGDTTVNVDSSGAVYQGNLNGNLQGDVWKSFDYGGTWPQRGRGYDGQDATGSPFFVDREWTDAWIPPGRTTDRAKVYIAYHDFAPSQVWVNASTDGGKTFGTPVDVISSPEAEAATFCNSIPGGVKVVQSGPKAGRIYAAWLAADLPTNVLTGCNLTQLNTFHTVWIAWSDNGGQTWTDQLVFDGGIGHDASALFADLTLDRLGNPYVAFGDNLGNEWDTYVMASFDGGRTWSGKSDGTGKPSKVNSDTGTHFFPAIAAGDPGKVDVAYLGTSKRIDTLPYGKPAPGGGAGADWYVYGAQSLNMDRAKPTWTVSRATRHPIHHGDVCTLGLFCAVFPTADRSLLDFIDVAIDGSGKAHVAFTRDTSGNKGIYVANQGSGLSVLSP